MKAGLEEKERTNKAFNEMFDVFLSHNSKDKPDVRRLDEAPFGEEFLSHCAIDVTFASGNRRDYTGRLLHFLVTITLRIQDLKSRALKRNESWPLKTKPEDNS